MSSQMGWSDFTGARARLSPAERQVLRRVDDDGESIEDVAEDRGTEETTVETLLHRARRKTGTAPQIT